MSVINQIPEISLETGVLNPSSVFKIKSGRGNQTASSDRSSFGILSQLAQRTGLDIAHSSRIVRDSTIQFSFNYQDTQIRNIQANGFLSAEKQSLSFDLSFEINESEITGDQSRNRTIRFDMHISVENFSMKQLEVGKTTESIQDFVTRIAKLIAKYAVDKDQEIAGLILDFKDVRDIYGIDNGKTLKLIMAAISILYITNKILDREKEDVVLYVKRKEEPYILLKKHKESNIQFSVSTQYLETKDGQKRQDQDLPADVSNMEGSDETSEIPHAKDENFTRPENKTNV